MFELRKNGFLQSNWNLAFSNDVARQNWGSSWRMPTLEEIKELFDFNNTFSENITRNGVKGTLVKSNKNVNTIFLPWGGVQGESGVIERGGVMVSIGRLSLQKEDPRQLIIWDVALKV